MTTFDTDTQLKLLAGIPLEIDGIGNIFAPTLRDIVQLGERKYNQMLSALLVDKSRLNEDFIENISDFEFIYLLCHGDESFKSEIIDFLKIVTKNAVTINSDSNNVTAIISLGDSSKKIDNGNFQDFIKIVRIQNCLDNIDEQHANPENEKVRQLLEKKKKLKKKLDQAKNQNDENQPLTLFDLISILASYSSNYNLINDVNNPMSIWNLTMFQFNDAFNRLRMFRDYEVNIQALLHGAKPDDVKLKHWLSKINND